MINEKDKRERFERTQKLQDLRIRKAELLQQLDELNFEFFLILHEAGQGDTSIARSLNVKPSTVQYWREMAELEPNKTRSNIKGYQMDPDTVRGRLKDYELGLTVSQMARRWGIKPVSVVAWLERRGLKPKEDNIDAV